MSYIIRSLKNPCGFVAGGFYGLYGGNYGPKWIYKNTNYGQYTFIGTSKENGFTYDLNKAYQQLEYEVDRHFEKKCGCVFRVEEA